MTVVDWIGLAVAAAICIALPFLHAAERRASARDRMRREELMRQTREYYGAQLAALQRKED